MLLYCIALLAKFLTPPEQIPSRGLASTPLLSGQGSALWLKLSGSTFYNFCLDLSTCLTDFLLGIGFNRGPLTMMTTAEGLAWLLSLWIFGSSLSNSNLFRFRILEWFLSRRQPLDTCGFFGLVLVAGFCLFFGRFWFRLGFGPWVCCAFCLGFGVPVQGFACCAHAALRDST